MSIGVNQVELVETHRGPSDFCLSRFDAYCLPDVQVWFGVAVAEVETFLAKGDARFLGEFGTPPTPVTLVTAPRRDVRENGVGQQSLAAHEALRSVLISH